MSARPEHGGPDGGLHGIRESLDQLVGKVEALAASLEEQSDKLVGLAERTAMLEQIGQETKQVVEAWTAAKGSLRFMKWLAGLVAAVAGAIAAIKGWPHK